MKTRSAWTALGCLMVLSLVTAPWAPSALGEQKQATPAKAKSASPTGPNETVTFNLKKIDGTLVEKKIEKPRYGGTFVEAWPVQPVCFDEIFCNPFTATTTKLTNEPLLEGDWTRGPAGTGENSYLYVMYPSLETLGGCLAEGWEIRDGNTVVVKIRRGVHWHDKPPMNGRELTANDVAFSLTRAWKTPNCYNAGVFPWDTHIESIEATDQWTLVLKCHPGKTGTIFQFATQVSTISSPPEVIEQYGDMKDWKVSCGTGPFMLKDNVEGSSLTLERNPNYWGHDPFCSENKLPYLQAVKYLIIPDPSTRMAALRTGKIDWVGGYGAAVNWEDAEQLIKSNPELKYNKYLSSSVPSLHYRVDKPELPWHNLQVRQALHMAIDNRTIASSYYGGQAELLTFQIPNIAEFRDMHTPLDQLADSTRELFQYHPNKAKQLLADAGYPNGFSAEVICTPSQVDLASIVKNYWAKIGVDLKIEVKENVVHAGMLYEKTFKEMAMSGVNIGAPFRMSYVVVDNSNNWSMINDPKLNEAYRAIQASFFDEPKQRQICREMNDYFLSQAYIMVFPGPYVYNFWQPWVKGYHGETEVGYVGGRVDFPRWIWYDEHLKGELARKR